MIYACLGDSCTVDMLSGSTNMHNLERRWKRQAAGAAARQTLAVIEEVDGEVSTEWHGDSCCPEVQHHRVDIIMISVNDNRNATRWPRAVQGPNVYCGPLSGCQIVAADLYEQCGACPESPATPTTRQWRNELRQHELYYCWGNTAK